MNLIIYGCGGHARSIADVAIANGYSEITFLDDYAKLEEKIFNFPIQKEIINSQLSSIVGLGDNNKRKHLFEQLDQKFIISLVSKDAYLGQEACIDKGTFIGHQAYIGPNAQVGKNTIINTRSIVEHDCVIGDHSHVSVGSIMAGKAKLGDKVFLGAGAIVVDGISVCSDVVIGAGAVVTKDIVESGIYVGIPACKIK